MGFNSKTSLSLRNLNTERSTPHLCLRVASASSRQSFDDCHSVSCNAVMSCVNVFPARPTQEHLLQAAVSGQHTRIFAKLYLRPLDPQVEGSINAEQSGAALVIRGTGSGNLRIE